MASTIAKIYQQLLAVKNSFSVLSGLNSNSQASIWNLWLYNTASAQSTFEQLSDQAQTDIENIIAYAPVFSLAWITQMCKFFQYSASNPQVITLNISNQYPFFTFSYPTVNEAYQIITQAAAVNNNTGNIVIKVAGNSSPLTSGQLSALTSYLNNILPPNVQYTLISDNADQLLIQGNIYFDASYAAVIGGLVDTAITNYLANLPFNGIVTISALETAILNVPGVKDLTLQNVAWRRATDSPPPAAGNNLISNYKLLNRNYQTYAGYVITEQTAGYTIDDLLTYSPA